MRDPVRDFRPQAETRFSTRPRLPPGSRPSRSPWRAIVNDGCTRKIIAQSRRIDCDPRLPSDHYCNSSEDGDVCENGLLGMVRQDWKVSRETAGFLATGSRWLGSKNHRQKRLHLPGELYRARRPVINWMMSTTTAITSTR